MRQRNLFNGSSWIIIFLLMVSIFLILVGNDLAYEERAARTRAPLEQRLSAVHSQSNLSIVIPYPGTRAERSGRLHVQLIDPDDKVLAERSFSVRQATRSGIWTVNLPLNAPLPKEELIWHRLRYAFATSDSATPLFSGIESVSTILKIPTIRWIGQSSYLAGTQAALRIIALDGKHPEPIDGNLRVDLLGGTKGARPVFVGKLDQRGTADVRFMLAKDDLGPRQLHVAVDTSAGSEEFTQPIDVIRRETILLSTDKPVYQPGQHMHIRVLALDRADRHAIANEALTIEVEDGKANKVFRRRTRTDEFGVSSAEFQLADEVNLGTYRVRARLGNENVQNPAVREKTVEVQRYVLPKFKVELQLDGAAGERPKRYYQPGEIVHGTVKAQYFFGQPVAQARITVNALAFDIASRPIGSQNGNTDAQGHFAFSIALPPAFVGLPIEKGLAPVVLEAQVTDSADHSETRSERITVSRDPILITAIPESGQIVPRLENRIFMLTSYPDGTPAQTEIRVAAPSLAGMRLATDESGIAVLKITPDAAPVRLHIEAQDASGQRSYKPIELDGRVAHDDLILRTDRSLYKVGDRVQLSIVSTQLTGFAYIDVVREQQTMLTRAVDLEHGKATASFDIAPDLFGAVQIRAYIFDHQAEPISDRKLVFIEPADELMIDATVTKAAYRPAEEAEITFDVRHEHGSPAVACLGVQVLDEAVLALAEIQPGFEKVFFSDEEALKPRFGIRSLSWDEVLASGHQVSRPTRQRRETAAQVLLAAANQKDRYVPHTDFGGRLPRAKYAEYLNRYWRQLEAKADRLARGINAYYRNSPSILNLSDHLPEIVKSGHIQAADLLDPWGSPIRILMTSYDPDSATAYYYFLSNGPDKRPHSGDEIWIASGWITKHASAQRKETYKLVVQKNLREETTRFVAPLEVATPFGGIVDNLAVAQMAGGIVGGVDQSTSISSIADNLQPADIVYRTPAGTARGIGTGPGFGVGTGRRSSMGPGMGGGVGAGMGVGVFNNITSSSTLPLATSYGDTGMAPREPVASQQNAKAVPSPTANEAPRLRAYFPETLYVNPSIITDGNGRATLRVPLADSITSWRMMAVASTQQGALGSGSAGIKVFQDSFIDLDLPAALTQGDVISIPVAVYNYLPQSQSFDLTLHPEDWFALEEDTPQKSVTVGRGEVAASYFRIKAEHIGKFKLTVSARVNGRTDAQPADAITREIEVAPNGQEQAAVINDRLQEGSQRHEITFPAHAIAEAGNIIVKLYPGPISQVVEGLDSLLRMPAGCFEQTSSTTYPNVLVLAYLKGAKRLTPEIRDRARRFISSGYQRLVTFEVPGGGFSWFGREPANKILTAYGLMEFYDMSRVHEVDPSLIARTQRWLAAQQLSSGNWPPDQASINEGATKRFTNDTLRITAYVAWALQATGYPGDAVERAKRYLESHLTGREDPYTLAVLANFAVDYGRDPAFTSRLFERLLKLKVETSKTVYWEQPGLTPTYSYGDPAQIETAALAAQALLKWGKASAVANKALQFLMEKKDAYGNWHSTQATILALKALLLSTEHSATDAVGTVDVLAGGRLVKRIEINKENNDLLHQVALKPEAYNGSNRIALRFNGQGSMLYQMVGSYYVPWTLAPPQADGPLTIGVTYDRTSLYQDDIVTADVTIRNHLTQTADMILVDLGIPPGFEPMAEDLERLMQGQAPGARLQKFNLTGKQITLYYDAIGAEQALKLSYRLRAKYPIRAWTPAARVYAYYNPEQGATARPVQLAVSPKRAASSRQ